MKTKILRNTFISVGVVLALVQTLAAGTSDGILNFSKSPPGLSQPPIITFDAPGAGTGPGQGTFALAISDPTGVITGDYLDAANVNHGFLRTRDGNITSFDAPGAIGTQAYSINMAETVTGAYGDSNDMIHGYLRTRDGVITTFDAPGAGPQTVPSDINPVGTIAGWYSDPMTVAHGFVRATNGHVTIFDA